MFNLALERLNCHPDDAIVVGDTLDTDILGANRAGIRAVLVESGNPANDASCAIPDLVLSDITQLGPLLGL